MNSPRVPLSIERVLETAMAMADERGLETLTMRRLAAELGVEAMSLYYYVSRKEEILDGIVDLVLAEIEPPSSGSDWKTAIRGSAISAHDALQRHPWAAGLMLSPSRLRPERMRFMDGMLARLREAGFSAGLIERAYHSLDGHIFGSILWALGISRMSAGYDDLASNALRDLPPDLPDLAEHIRSHMTGPGPEDEDGFSFVFGLDLILEGLERIATGPDGHA
jgi:AcrR family transcriptional regulator